MILSKEGENVKIIKAIQNDFDVIWYKLDRL